MGTNDIKIPERLLGDLPDELTNAEEAAHTLVHCTYVSKEIYVRGGWVNIWPTTYLEYESSGERLPMMHALVVPLAPAKHYFQSPGQVKRFTLVFPQVPKTWSSFMLKEYTATELGFVVHAITRNSLGVYHVRLG